MPFSQPKVANRFKCPNCGNDKDFFEIVDDVIDEETGEVLLAVNEEVTADKLEALREAGVEEFKVLFIDGLNVGRNNFV